jgi:hypothetical protein
MGITVRLRRHLDSETLHVPEIRPLLGRDVEIEVREVDGSGHAGDGSGQSSEAARVLTLEEARALPPPTADQLARRRAALDAVDSERAAFVAAGGKLMTDEEWQEFWDSRWDDDEDESWPGS